MVQKITLAYKCQRQMKIFSIECKHWTLFRNMYTSFSKGDNLYDQYPKYLLLVTDTEEKDRLENKINFFLSIIL